MELVHSKREFFSPIFLTPKKKGMILNLTELNKSVVYQHSKIDSLKCVTGLMTQGCSMVSVDIKDTYYTVPVALAHQNHFKFI